MLVFPNCKINLGLRIIRKREDGYHDLETIFYPVGWKDVLEIIRKDDGRLTTDHSGISNSRLTTDGISFTSTGLAISGEQKDNLCIKAYNLLKKDFPSLPSVQMHLHKVIPMGAGLGGGSSNGAFTLTLLNKKFQLNLTTQQLMDYALQLGSDCPFFILNQPGYATGRGELLEKVELDLSAYRFVMVNPGIHVNTGWAFAQIKPAVPEKSIKEIILQPIQTWKDELKNDFEEPVSKAHPEIASIKQQFYDAGAIYASMTGSGSTVFGVFEKGVKNNIQFQNEYSVKWL